jgi:hypothetical protein
MKLKTALTIIIVCITAAVTSLEAKSILFRNGKTAYTIVTCSDASVSELTAAKELSTYLNSISGAEFPVVKEDEADLKGRHIFIGYSPAYGKDLQADRPEDDFEGFRYCNVGKDIWIYGGKGRGTMYGVFSFLENELGVRWYASDCTKVPSLKVWGFEKLDVSERPAIRYRFTQYRNVERNPEWLAHNKYNSVWNACENQYGGLSSYWNAHTFEQFVPSG